MLHYSAENSVVLKLRQATKLYLSEKPKQRQAKLTITVQDDKGPESVATSPTKVSCDGSQRQSIS